MSDTFYGPGLTPEEAEEYQRRQDAEPDRPALEIVAEIKAERH